MRAFNKPDKIFREEIFGVCKNIVRRLTDYFFMKIYLGTASFGNRYLFTQIKEHSSMTEYFGPIYINFDDYLAYSGRISEIVEIKDNSNIQCDHGYA